MNKEEFAKRLNSRSKMYAGGRVMDTSHCIAVRIDPRYARSFEGQVSLIVLASLLSRITTNLRFDIPSVRIHTALPWKHKSLAQVIQYEVCLNRPDQDYKFQPVQEGDYVLNVGPKGGAVNVHSCDWFAYVGNSSSPLPKQNVLNPMGAIMAAITAVTLLFDVKPQPIEGDYVFDTFKWEENPSEFRNYPYKSFPFLGNLWFVGLGSVGTCALYFLSLATRNFLPALIDMDKAEIENMDRSAIFRHEHNGHYKVDAVKSFLNSIGFTGIPAEKVQFFHSELRKNRQATEPDIIISAANEYNVRHTIEEFMPPIQLYATTGEHFQTTLFRHIPLADPCSCCVFPPEKAHADSVCAGGEIEDKKTGKKIDAALPFLSYMAGLMTAVEILKLSLPNYPYTSNKVTFWASPKKRNPRFVHQEFKQRQGCDCQTRYADIHGKLIAGSKYAHLSGEVVLTVGDVEIKPPAVPQNDEKEKI